MSYVNITIFIFPIKNYSYFDEPNPLQVYVDELDANDYLFICRSQYPSIPETVLSNLICFNKRLFEDTMIHQKYGQEGSPWEFNLRDVIRSCQIIEGAYPSSNLLFIR